jgi:hypothetical protein
MTADIEVRDSGNGSESDRETDFAMRFGGGVDLYASENTVLGLGVDFVLPTDKVNGLDYISIGLGFQYRFGGPSSAGATE